MRNVENNIRLKPINQSLYFSLFTYYLIILWLYYKLKKYLRLKFIPLQLFINFKSMQNPNQDPNAKDFYSKADFWDERYQAGGYFDWYAEYPELQYAFQTQYGMAKQDHILMVGCGNSQLSQQMFEAGYKNICNIDISPIVIQQMKNISPSMEWLVMDATQMTFEDHKFDYVIDKGTMDALIAGRDLTPAIKLLKQCMRVTKQQGQFIQITYGSPQGRKKVFENSLPFDRFDYYFAYVNLNDMSTMINLMRNNLIGPDGQRLDKQLALQKSLKEFMMIKIMRAKRSKQKQFVVWQNFNKKVENEKQINTQILPKKQVSQVQKLSEVKQTTQKKPQTENSLIPNQIQIKYQSKPQKQSYVYAYSIKRKFAYNFNPFQMENVETKQFYESISKQSLPLSIKGDETINQLLAKCKAYCERKNIAHSSVNFIEKQSSFSTDDQSIKINLKEGNCISLKILVKSNIELIFKFKNCSKLLDCLKGLGTYLVQKMGLGFHPCPKTYSLFSMIKGRMKVTSTNELLKKYWYPTFEIKSIDMKNEQASVTLSVPPVLPEVLEQVKKLIQSYFAKKEAKEISLLIGQLRNGFVSFPQLTIFSAFNMASLSYNEGKSLKVQMIDFSGQDQKYESEQKSKLFIVQNSQVEVPKQLIPMTLLHLMCFS